MIESNLCEPATTDLQGSEPVAAMDILEGYSPTDYAINFAADLCKTGHHWERIDHDLPL